jgi:hypothetical protein
MAERLFSINKSWWRLDRKVPVGRNKFEKKSGLRSPGLDVMMNIYRNKSFRF